jgi:hypothetical protein
LEKIGNILDVILNPATLQGAVEYSKLYKTWNDIIDEAFINKRQSETEEIEDSMFNDGEVKNRINARKLHDHSRVREFDRQRLVVETDHPGWIQILQYKQYQLLAAAQQKFPNLSIKRISFVLMRKKENS